MTATGSADFLPMLGIRTFAIATGPTTAASVAVVPEDALGMFALAYHSVRDALGAELAIDAGARTFVDGPNIAALTIDVADRERPPASPAWVWTSGGGTRGSCR